MSTYTTTNVKSDWSGYSAANWTTFGNDCNSNFANAFTSRWTLSTRFQNSLNAVDASMKTAFASLCAVVSSAISGGGTVDFSGIAISDSNSGGGIHPNGQWIIHTDWQWVGTSYVLTSFWIEHNLS